MSKVQDFQWFFSRYSPHADRFGGAFGIALQITQKIEPPPPPPPKQPEPQASPNVGPLIHEIEFGGESIEIGEGYGYSLEGLEAINPDLDLEDNPEVRMEDGTLLIDDEALYQDIQETVEPWDDFLEADGIAQDVDDGMSLDLVAEERGLTREQVLDQLEAGGFEVDISKTIEGSNIIRITEITNPETGEIVAEYHNTNQNTYRTVKPGEQGPAISPIRDNQGRKVTHEENSETGATTTRYEDDLGDGTVLERTKLPSQVVIEKTTNADGEVTTVVIDKQGARTTLEEGQETTREGIDGIAEDISKGRNIAEIAEERGLTLQQITAQLKAVGFVLMHNSDDINRYSIRMVNVQSGEEIASYNFTLKSNITTSHYIDVNGREVRTTESGNDGRHTETVIEANGRETTTTEDTEGNTTVEITFNGYTLTTPPDGDLILRDNESGMEVKIDRGTSLESLVTIMLRTNPQSSDPEEAKEDQIIQTVVERVLAGKTLSELESTLEARQEDKQKAIGDYGAGQPGINATHENPYGDPPPGTAPSGGKWVPMNGVWMDPKVAKAIAAESTALAEQVKAQATFRQDHEKLNVYALDPDYAQALDNAGAALDEALAPHGLRWKRPEAEGSLEKAQTRLKEADSQLESARKAKTEYEQAQELLGDAITKKEVMQPFSDGATSLVSGPDIDVDFGEANEKGKAAQAEVDALFYEAALHSSKGNDLLTGYMVSQLQTQLEAAEPGTELHKKLEGALKQAKADKDGASNQLDAAQAYYNFYAAKDEIGQLALQSLVIKEKLLDDYNARNEYLFEEGEKHRLGALTSQEVVEREGQLWVVNNFEEGTTDQQLTIHPDERPSGWGEIHDIRLNRQWHELVTGSDPNACGTDGLISTRRQELIAGRELNEFLQKQLGVQTDNLDTQIGDLEEEYKKLFEQHGPGTVEAPEGMEDTETINIGGIDIEVSPQTKEAVEEQWLDALIASGEQVRIEIDGEQRWVNPELAVSSIALDLAREQRETAEQTRQQAESAIDAQIEMYDYRLTQPIKLLPDSESAEHEAGLQFTYLEENEREALDGIYQLSFKNLIENNPYSEEFTTFSATELETQVANTLNLSDVTPQGRETLGKITEEIHELGGDNPSVKIIPIIYIDDTTGQTPNALFAVKNEDGDTRYVDATGKHFENLEDFQDNNQQFREDGKLIVPTDLKVAPNDDGTIALDVVQASNVSVFEKTIDPVIGIGTGLATVGTFIPNPFSAVFAGVAYAGAAYLGGRSVMHQWNHIQHGGEWSDKQSVMNTLSIATTLMPIGSSGLRTFGMARHFDDVSRSRAFLASIGAVSPGSQLAKQSVEYMASPTGLNRLARGLDWSAIGTGVPMMAVSVQDLAKYRDQMSGLDITNALVGTATGFVGTGLGAHGLWRTRPHQVEAGPSTSSPPNINEVMAAIDPAAFQDSLAAAGVDPETAHDLAAALHQPINEPPSLGSWRLLPHEVAALTGEPSHLAKLTPEEFALFTPEQLSQFTLEQMSIIKQKQLAALSGSQLAAFTHEQSAVLTHTQKARLTAEQKANLSEQPLQMGDSPTRKRWANILGTSLAAGSLLSVPGVAYAGWTGSALDIMNPLSAALIINSLGYAARGGLTYIKGRHAMNINQGAGSIIDSLDPRRGKGQLLLSAILATHLLNDQTSFQNIINGGLFVSEHSGIAHFLQEAGLVGFLAANMVLAGSAAAKLGPGIARVDLQELGLLNKLTKVGTATGSYLYAVFTLPYIVSQMDLAAKGFTAGNLGETLTYGTTSLGAVFLSYYGIKGLRYDSIAMRDTLYNREIEKPRIAPYSFFIGTGSMAAVSGAEAFRQAFFEGNPLMATTWTAGTLLQFFFLHYGSRRIDWSKNETRHGPFRELTSIQSDRDPGKTEAGIGWSLALTMGGAVPLAVSELLDNLEKEYKSRNDWLNDKTHHDLFRELTSGVQRNKDPGKTEAGIDWSLALTMGGAVPLTVSELLDNLEKEYKPRNDGQLPESSHTPEPESNQSPLPHPSETPSPDQPYSFIVTAPSGLNLRFKPTVEALIVTVFPHGTVLEGAGPQETDDEGISWSYVTGQDLDGNQQGGWVATHYIEEEQQPA